MSAPTIATGRTWVDGETVTPSRINATVNAATLNFTATKKLAARTSSGAGAAEEATFGTTGQAVAAADNQADGRTALGLDSMSTQAASAVAITGGTVKVPYYAATPSTLTYGATTTVDFSSSAASAQTVSLTGNVTLASSNLAAGRTKALRLVADSSTRTLSFPASWIFTGATRPTDLPANKTARLNLESWGTTDADVIACYSAEP